MMKLFCLTFLAACSAHAADGGVDADATSTTGDAGYVVVPPMPVDPDLGCLAPSTAAVDPLVLGGSILEVTTTAPIDVADVALFRAGEPTVLARAHTTNSAFSTTPVVTGGHALHAYLKATKPGYRTAFFYPAFPFAENASNLVVPMISDAMFETVKTTLGATQDDRHNGVLLVAVVDCAGKPLAGTTLSVRHGATQVGQAYELETGVYLVFDVPDGKVWVSATYNGTQLPEHDVMVRAKDPDCATTRGTLTSTIVKPGA